MSFSVSARALKQLQSRCSLSFCSRRWFKGSTDFENLNNSVTIGGKTIKYIRTGEGEHAVLCLSGGFRSAIMDFKSLIEGLNQKEFTVIAWDPPGYGYSRPPNRDFSPGFLKRDADDAVDLMKAIGIPKFSVLGWRDGGITGIFLASKYPENLRKMAIWGARAYVTDEEAEIFKKIRDGSTWSEQMKAPMVELYGEDGFRTMWEQWVDEFLRIHREDGGDICKTELKFIQCPLFVLHGRMDANVPLEHPKYIIDNVPDSQLFTFKYGQHDFHKHYDEEFNWLVDKFLTSNQSSSSSERRGCTVQGSGAADPRVAIRLPLFQSENPAVWFARIEAHFQLSQINDDLTKFNCVLSHLDTKYAARVVDIICDPPGDDKYNVLKSALIERLDEDRLKRTLSRAEIGTKKPSEFLNHLRELAGSNVSESQLSSVWLGGLPQRVQAAVTAPSAPLDSLAELADQEAERQPLSVDSVCSNQNDYSASKQPARKFAKLVASPESKPRLQKDYSAYLRSPCYDAFGWKVASFRTSARNMLRGLKATSDYRSVLAEFPDIVYPPEGPQECQLHIRHRVLTKSNSPVCVEPPFLSEAETLIARHIIDSMLEQGTMRPSDSPYGSPFRVTLHVQLRDTCWRGFCDYRLLNVDTVRDTYKMRHPAEISESVRDCRVFSVVHLRKSWTLIPVEPEDVAKTAVVTPFGKFEFPYKPRTLGDPFITWQKIIDEMLQGLPCCFGYLNAILVFSKDHLEHREHLQALFEKLSMSRIFVNPSYTVLGEPSVDFAHYSFSGLGCSPIPERVSETMENIRAPHTYSEFSDFLGTCNLYSHCIPAYARNPFKAVPKGFKGNFNSPVLWTPMLEEAFKECKSALTRTTLHSRPDPSAPLSISISVIDDAIGAVLNQYIGGNAVPLAFCSSTLEGKKPSQVIAYLNCLYTCIRTFLPFLVGRKFTVFTNYNIELDSYYSPYAAFCANHCSQFHLDIQHVHSGHNTVVARSLARLVRRPEFSAPSLNTNNRPADSSYEI